MLQQPPQYDQRKLQHLLGSAWVDRDETFDDYIHTGWNLSAHVGTYERVLHVECTKNPFRYIVPHVIGIDSREEYIKYADYNMDIVQYYTAYKYRRAHVAFCLECFDYETQKSLETKLDYLVRMMTPQDSRIFFRNKIIIPETPVEPPVAEPSLDPSAKPLYPWTVEEHVRLADMFGYEVIDVQDEINDTIYVHWRAKNVSYGQV